MYVSQAGPWRQQSLPACRLDQPLHAHPRLLGTSCNKLHAHTRQFSVVYVKTYLLLVPAPLLHVAVNFHALPHSQGYLLPSSVKEPVCAGGWGWVGVGWEGGERRLMLSSLHSEP